MLLLRDWPEDRADLFQPLWLYPSDVLEDMESTLRGTSSLLDLVLLNVDDVSSDALCGSALKLSGLSDSRSEVDGGSSN